MDFSHFIKETAILTSCWFVPFLIPQLVFFLALLHANKTFQMVEDPPHGRQVPNRGSGPKAASTLGFVRFDKEREREREREREARRTPNHLPPRHRRYFIVGVT